MHYIVGDIHGCYDEWILLKNKIESIDSQARFVLTGDIVDRGPKVMKMIHWAIQHVSKTGKYQMILGNHEFEKIYWLDSYFDLQKRNLSLKDMWSDGYDFRDVLIEAHATDEEIKHIYDFFHKLPPIKEIDIRNRHFIIAHGGVPSYFLNEDESFDYKYLEGSHAKMVTEDIVWLRTNKNPRLKNTIVIHGHTPIFVDNISDCVEGQIYYNENNINVDCGCVYRKWYPSGNLAAIRLEDFEEFYVYDKLSSNDIYKKRNQLYREKLLSNSTISVS